MYCIDAYVRETAHEAKALIESLRKELMEYEATELVAGGMAAATFTGRGGLQGI